MKFPLFILLISAFTMDSNGHPSELRADNVDDLLRRVVRDTDHRDTGSRRIHGQRSARQDSHEDSHWQDDQMDDWFNAWWDMETQQNPFPDPTHDPWDTYPDIQPVPFQGIEPPFGLDQFGTTGHVEDFAGIHWAQTEATHEGDSSEEDWSQVDNTAYIASQLRHQGRQLDGPAGSVCNYQVVENVWHEESVPYPCWHMQPSSCWQCGRNCRRRNRQCQRLTHSICHRTEMRCSQQMQTHFYCCPGFEQQGNTCVRTVTGGCLHQNGGCDHFCRTDHRGNPRCECFDGYSLVDGRRCVDKNECADNNGGCNHFCTNTEGSFSCSCHNGYRLQDSYTCAEINECHTGNGGCAHQCHNTDGAFYCECDLGFSRIEGFKCQDVDECTVNSPCSHECYNLPGGYICACPAHMRLDSKDNETCLEKLPVVAGGSGDKSSGSGTTDQPMMGVGMIAGGAGGGVVLLCVIALFGYICYRGKKPDSPSSASRDNDTQSQGSRGGRNQYESAARGARQKFGDDSSHFENHGYVSGKLDVPLPPPVVGVEYMSPEAPPSYQEATAPPAPESPHVYLALVHPGYLQPNPQNNQRQASGVYEPMNYEAMNNSNKEVAGEYDNSIMPPTPPPPRPSQIAAKQKATVSRPPLIPPRPKAGEYDNDVKSSPSSAAKSSSGSVATVDSKQLANALKKLKKVAK